MGDLSDHFARQEFRCHHCGALPGDPHRELVAAAETLRAAGFPHGLTVESGYRCPAYQEQLRRRMPTRAAKRSQHPLLTALDFPPVMELDEVLDLRVFSGVGWQYIGPLGRRRRIAVHGDVRHVGVFNPNQATLARPDVWQYR
jgi:hypothetical protein